MKRLARWFGLVLGILLVPANSQAHFLWITSGSDKVFVSFAETAGPDDPALEKPALDNVARAELWSVGAREPQKLTLRRTDGRLEAELTPPATTFLRHTYGVLARGEAPFLLRYYAKSYPHVLPGTWRPVRDAERLPLEIVPTLEPRGLRLQVTWKGQPLPGAPLAIVGPGGLKRDGTTDDTGSALFELAAAGLYSIRTKHTESTPGTFADQEYRSVRHHATLTLPHVPPRLAPVTHDLPALPKGTTSFGGAVAGDTLFVYGGNYGSSHSYATEDQSGDLWHLDLKQPREWQVTTGGPKRQGLAMVEHQGRLYRVGGFLARNKAGEKDDLCSQADCARLSPPSATWEPLPSLPEPRSSHDAAVVGDVLYVVGGWNMPGSGGAPKWHRNTLALNLASQPLEWRTVAPPPFERRALSLAAWQGKLFCVGGMQMQGGPTTAVAVYDPAKNEWSDGPALLGGPMDGFGASAFATRDALYVTTSTGSIQRLTTDGRAWEFHGQLAYPRFFHRLLAWQGEKLLIVGGTNMTEGKTERLELLAPGK